MNTKSRIARSIPQDESSLRHLPLVELLVDTWTELFELAMRSGLRVFTAMLEEDRTAICGPRYAHQPDRVASRAGATVDFLTGAVEQGEKVKVFSCFDEPIQKLAARFGDQAVVLTGRTPSDQRQGLVDRFQNDPHVRVFVANILAGGVGVTLTAATQVVFNDLDWVPANHWQAEDRAYRIGQTQTVNVTYVVARDTIDDFVQAVLQTKSDLVSAVVDGTALAEGDSESVLDALERAVRALSPGLADSPHGLEDDEVIARLLREAADAQHRRGAVDAGHSRGLAPCMAQCGRLSLAAGVRRPLGTIGLNALVYVLGRSLRYPWPRHPGVSNRRLEYAAI